VAGTDRQVSDRDPIERSEKFCCAWCCECNSILVLVSGNRKKEKKQKLSCVCVKIMYLFRGKNKDISKYSH
jgi:hypothetical protein